MENLLAQARFAVYEVCGVLFACGLLVGFLAGLVTKPKVRRVVRYLGFGTSIVVVGIAGTVFLSSHGYN